MAKPVILALVEDGVVQSVRAIPMFQLQDGQSAVVVPDGVSVVMNDLYSNGVFSANPAAADLAAAAAKVLEIKQALDEVTTTAELKAKVAEIDGEINP